MCYNKTHTRKRGLVVMKNKHKLRWMPLDNAAKIYPAARSRNWSNVFRVSANLVEEIDRAVLKDALDVVVHRFRPLRFAFAEARFGII